MFWAGGVESRGEGDGEDLMCGSGLIVRLLFSAGSHFEQSEQYETSLDSLPQGEAARFACEKNDSGSEGERMSWGTSKLLGGVLRKSSAVLRRR